MLAIKSRAKFEQVASKIRSFREHTCARDRDLIASKCTYDSEPHCNCVLYIVKHPDCTLLAKEF